MKTRVTEMLGIRYPIVQGGLARVAYAELAAAVSNAGGLGQINTASLLDPEALRAEIRRCQALTSLPFGVNFPINRHDLNPLLDVALEEGSMNVKFAFIPKYWRAEAQDLATLKGEVPSPRPRRVCLR